MKLIQVSDDESWRETLRACLESKGDKGDDRYPNHPGCNPWKWNVRPVIVNRDYTVAPGNMRDGEWPDERPRYSVIPGAFVFMPRQYVETLGHMPENAWGWMVEAIVELGLTGKPHNWGLNSGSEAGQTFSWPHLWIVDRAILTAFPKKGFATVLFEGTP